MKKISIERMRPIRDDIYIAIRRAIISGKYKPGERLQEENLAKELGTSRTPVREALRKLEVEKMVVHFPHRGTVVSEVAMDEMEDLYAIRSMIEGIIARRAAERATEADISRLKRLMDDEEAAKELPKIADGIDAYNFAITEIADCKIIADLSRKVRETLSRMIVLGHTNPNRRQDAQHEHREIVAAIASGDAGLAQRLTIEHVSHAKKILDKSGK